MLLTIAPTIATDLESVEATHMTWLQWQDSPKTSSSFRLQLRLETPAWPSVVMYATDTSQSPVWPSVVTCIMDINTDPGFNRTTDPDMALRGNMDPDISVASGGSIGSPCQYGPQ